jgi:hypothetical protein
MRRQDKKTAMVEANKRFQERANAEDPTIQEKKIEYTYVPDIFPELSRMLK